MYKNTGSDAWPQTQPRPSIAQHSTLETYQYTQNSSHSSPDPSTLNTYFETLNAHPTRSTRKSVRVQEHGQRRVEIHQRGARFFMEYNTNMPKHDMQICNNLSICFVSERNSVSGDATSSAFLDGVYAPFSPPLPARPFTGTSF